MRRRIWIIAAVAALVLSTTSPAGARGGASDRPFNVTIQGTVTFEFSQPECTDFRNVLSRGEGFGVASHMGRVEIQLFHCPVGVGHVNGHATYTAANGDELWFEYEHTTSEPMYPMSIVGGTGRFVGATGSAIQVFTVEQEFIPGCVSTIPFYCFDLTVPWHWTGTLTGVISY